MTSTVKKPRRIGRVSKDQWLAAALAELKRGGIAAVKVERLADIIGVAKAGFYWHFKDRADLHKHMLDYWSRQFTSDILSGPELAHATPVERLSLIIRLIEEHDLDQFEIAVRGWAQHDKRAAKVYRQTIATRLDFVRRTFAELGFKGSELEIRARAFVGYFSWERSTFGDDIDNNRRAINSGLTALLTNA